jgi:hypothetical protein
MPRVGDFSRQSKKAFFQLKHDLFNHFNLFYPGGAGFSVSYTVPGAHPASYIMGAWSTRR